MAFICTTVSSEKVGEHIPFQLKISSPEKTKRKFGFIGAKSTSMKPGPAKAKWKTVPLPYPLTHPLQAEQLSLIEHLNYPGFQMMQILTMCILELRQIHPKFQPARRTTPI